MKFKIYAGLGGGFGGGNHVDTIECDNEDQAWDYAFECACEEYESYAGMYGLRDTDEIFEDLLEEFEEEPDDEEVWLEYCEERESWLDYYVEEVVENE